MGYRNSTFPLAIYGSIDTASGKLMWLRIWVTNCDPNIIGRWYLEYLYQTRRLPSILRVDRGTDGSNGYHAYLRRNHGDMDAMNTLVLGPSTANQVRSQIL